MAPDTVTTLIAAFEVMPDMAGISIPVWQTLCGGRSRTSIYRDIEAGRLEKFNIGKSTLLRVGSCRKLLRGEV